MNERNLFGAGFSSLILIQMLCSTGILILYSSNKSILINACQKYLHSFFCCKHYIIFSFSLNNFLEACHLSLIFHQSFFCNHDHQVYLHTNAYDFLDFSYASINLELFTVKIEKWWHFADCVHKHSVLLVSKIFGQCFYQIVGTTWDSDELFLLASYVLRTIADIFCKIVWNDMASITTVNAQ